MSSLSTNVVTRSGVCGVLDIATVVSFLVRALYGGVEEIQLDSGYGRARRVASGRACVFGVAALTEEGTHRF